MFPYGDITFAFLGITLLFFDIQIYFKSGMAVDRGFINKFITALCQCTLQACFAYKHKKQQFSMANVLIVFVSKKQE